MPPVKVLEVLEANVGGARKHVLQILRGLDRERFEVHLACSVDRDPASRVAVESLRDEGIRVELVRMLRRPAPIADVAALRQLSRLIRAERYGIVHTHCAKAGFLGRRAARKAGVPAVLHTPHCFPFQRVDTPLVPLYRFLERRAARWADRIVLVAESQRRVALDARLCDEDRLVVVENGISMPIEDPEALRRRFRRELGIPETTLAVAFIGRITPQKDAQTFLTLAQDLLARMPETRVFLVGGAEGRHYLHSLRPRIGEAARRVVVHGEAPSQPVHWSPSLAVQVLGHRPDSPELAAAFDAVVLPSRYEGLPYSLLEAMACAVPVLASDVSGNRDVIEHERSGLLAPQGDRTLFWRNLHRLLADPDLRRTLGAAARERVAARFTEERFLSRITELYESALDHSSR